MHTLAITTTVLSLIAAGAFTACREPGPVGPSAQARARLSANAASLPFQARAELRMLAPTVPPAGRCADPAAMLSTFTGTMDGTHVGKATLLAQHCVNFADLLCKQGTITITAANQDVLEARYECPMGRIEEGVAHWTSHFTFVGGTGRFLHASGGALEVGSINMATGLGGSALSGDLRYVASDRRR